VIPVCAYPTATVKVNGATVASGTASNPLNLAIGNNVINTVVTSADGISTATYAMTVTRLPDVYQFNSAASVPVTVSDFMATGSTATFALGYAPTPGMNLTVVRDTGTRPIQGAFDNLAQGQAVTMSYGGITYPFVANYFGGTGNDLVLQWGNTRMLAWGDGGFGQLGSAAGNSYVPVPVTMSGVLAGKTVVSVADGGAYCLALGSDGAVAAWGRNTNGQLGNNSTTNSSVPVLITQTGVLAGKTVVAVAAGDSSSLVLCSDGTLATWGYNGSGQLGNGTTVNSPVPVLVNQAGVLAGKTVIAIAAGGSHNLALCSDGSLAAWGYNSSGQLGNNSMIDSSVPVLVNLTNGFGGKTVSAMAAGASHSLAAFTDGTVVAWGSNSYGQLGNNSSLNSSMPVAVTQTGVLAGKTVVALAAGSLHSLALCSDGTLAAWGYDSYGQLGNSSYTTSNVPVLVTQTGVLAGKAVVAVAAGNLHSLALCSDGTLAAWGTGGSGQLGNAGTADSNVPVAVSTSALAPGECFVTMAGATAQSLALVAMPPVPVATTVVASAILDAGATLNTSVSAQGNTATVSFDFGLTTSYGTTLAATPATVSGTASTPASAAVSGLVSGTTYHYRVVATGSGGTVRGADMTFTTTTLADLSSMTLSSGTLDPSFAGINTNYLVTLPFVASSLTVTPVCVEPTSRVRVNGTAVASGAASGPINLAVGNNVISTVVTSIGGSNTKTYTVTVYRLPETFTYNSASDVPVTAGAFLATGVNASFTLNYAPLAGTNLMVVKNTASGPIRGAFDNLANGQTVNLTYGGINFTFVANYFGGTGNDLVLQWANTRLLAWGYNTDGELGNNSTTQSKVPVPVTMSGVLAGRTILSIAAGDYHSLALCSDGTVAAWGSNSYGQLGIGSSTTSKVPVWVNRTGVLAGKTVVAIAAGGNVSLALCSDGAIATWGDNSYGQLGNGGTSASKVPVLVNQAGVLAGRTVIGVTTGGSHSLALCADGTVAGWGYNFNGQLGNSATSSSSVPVMVNQTTVLASKTVLAIAAGQYHSMALCADGTLAAWGYNNYGQLGNNTTSSSNVPVAVTQTGVLAGKTPVAIAAEGANCLVLCADGTLAAWGYNAYGQLGNNTTTNSSVPVLVTQTGVLAGKAIQSMSAGSAHALALGADGTMATWGYNAYGQLGNNTTTNSSVPVLVIPNGLGVGERFVTASCGADHSLALVATPPPTLISGFVLADTNNDRVGDAPLGGVILTLKDSSGNDIDSDPVATGVQPTTTTTAADGSYSFPNLSPGNYRVVITRPPGYLGVSDVDGGSLDVIGDVTPIAVLLSHNTANQNFVVVKAGSIGNLVWFDANRNGLVDPGEPGLPGVTVRLYKSTQTPGVDPPVATTVTDANGIYNFTNIYPGDYVVYLPAPPYSAPSLSLVQDHNDDQIDNDNNGSQAVFGGPVSSPVVTISPGENDLTIDFGFTWYGPWQEWQHLNPLGGKNQPGDNPDGDNYDNLIEYAFNLSSGSGAGSPFSINPSTVSTGRVELTFTRPVGATTSVTYYLEYSSTLGPATSWISIPLTTINPRNLVVTPLTAELETFTIRNLEAREGFVRFRAELDANGDQIIDHISYTGVQGWTESAMELGTRTYNNPYQHSSIFTGTVDATGGVSGQTLNFATSAGTTDLATLLTPGATCYLEVTAGVNEGQRFDVVSATGSALALASVSDVCSDTPPFNTLAGALPATLAGNRIAIHRHWTLGELFPVTRFFAADVATDADQVQTSAVATTGTYWLYSNGGSPKWVKLGDGTLADQGSSVIAPGHGMIVTKHGIAAPLLACGEVRANNFVRPLCSGVNLVGGGYPIIQSATGPGSRQMALSDGFLGSTDPASADMFSVWKGDATPGVTGYDNYYLYNPGTAPKWVKTGDATLASHDAEVLFLGDRSVLIQVKNDVHGYTIPNQSLVPSLIAVAQSANPMQDLTASGSAQDAASALIAYAFGLDPAGNTAAQLPQAQLKGDSYVIEFNRPTGVSNITYGAEWSATLLPGSWSEIPDSGTGDRHIFSVPADQPRMFLRLKVSGE